MREKIYDQLLLFVRCLYPLSVLITSEIYSKRRFLPHQAELAKMESLKPVQC